MTRPMASRSVPTLIMGYLALVVIGGVGSHLVSEFAAMGAAAGAFALSPLHAYLGVALVAAAVVLAFQLRSLKVSASNARDAKRIAELGLASLPFRGKGRGFWLTTAGLQFAVAWATVIAEGSPLFGHDIAAGILGAIISSALLALIARALTRSLPALASAMVEFAPTEASGSRSITNAGEEPALTFAASTWCSRLFNRPPPVLQSA